MNTNIDLSTELVKLKQNGYEKLNFGCGGFPLAGWTNIDGGDGKVWHAPSDDSIVRLDAFVALREIPSNSASYVFSEQFFEHFDRPTGLLLLKEWFRVLKPGGVLRIQTPDLYKEVLIYLNKLDFVDWKKNVVPRRLKQIEASKEEYCKLAEGEAYTRSMLLNNGMHLDGHRFLYDFETLQQSLRLAGFHNIEQVEFGISKHQELNGINLHDGGSIDRSWIPKIVLEVEGLK